MNKTYIQNISEALDKIEKPPKCFPWSATFAEIRGVDKPKLSYNKVFHDDVSDIVKRQK